METSKIKINDIPSIIWEEKSSNVFMAVHGNMSNKQEEERSQNLIDAIDAKLFIQEYIDNSNGKLDDDKVIAGEDAWNNLNDAVKELANS